MVVSVSNRDQAIEKAQEVVDAWGACIASGRSLTSKAVVDLKTEELIDVLLECFDSGEIDQGKLVALFDESGSLLEMERLGQIPEAMVPVAIMREVLHRHRVMFNPKNVANWKAFVMRFGRYIMQS